mmetsp:Transcript_21902/g.39360  ORF Transcript_21902/g.39360 Transcript_21902/m.39360 type:complete len:247 (+) Transcript_21902:719-1459(+)
MSACSTRRHRSASRSSVAIACASSRKEGSSLLMGARGRAPGVRSSARASRARSSSSPSSPSSNWGASEANQSASIPARRSLMSLKHAVSELSLSGLRCRMRSSSRSSAKARPLATFWARMVSRFFWAAASCCASGSIGVGMGGILMAARRSASRAGTWGKGLQAYTTNTEKTQLGARSGPRNAFSAPATAWARSRLGSAAVLGRGGAVARLRKRLAPVTWSTARRSPVASCLGSRSGCSSWSTRAS